MQKLDETTRHDAALAHASGDSKSAIAMLIKRINDSNGHCDAKIWLCALDIYQIQKQRAAYEKIAVFFANRFHFSAPAWEYQESETRQTGQWRNALIVEGSPLTIHQEKIRDFIKASKEAKESRIDLSRMRLSFFSESGENLDVLERETAQLLDIMMRLRRAECPTLLMGEAEVLRQLKKMSEDILKQRYPDQDQPKAESPIWKLLFEILQWRGLQEEFEALALDFAEYYLYCPVGYDPHLQIAIKPTTEKTEGQVGAGSDPSSTRHPLNLKDNSNSNSNSNEFGMAAWSPEETILHATSIMQFIEHQWAHGMPATMDFSHVHRITFEAAQELAAFLQAIYFNNEDEGRVMEDTTSIDLKGVNEITGAILETAGIGAFASISYKHEKLRHLKEQ